MWWIFQIYRFNFSRLQNIVRISYAWSTYMGLDISRDRLLLFTSMVKCTAISILILSSIYSSGLECSTHDFINTYRCEVYEDKSYNRSRCIILLSQYYNLNRKMSLSIASRMWRWSSYIFSDVSFWTTKVVFWVCFLYKKFVYKILFCVQF